MEDNERCKHEGYSGSTWNRTMLRCAFKASTEAGYCKRHDPERIKVKSDARNSKWEAELAASDHKNRIKTKESEALEVIKKIATGVDYPTERAKDFMRELNEVINGQPK